MRACNACFYGKFKQREEEGECWVAPPQVLMAHDGEGTATLLNVRPAVLRSDYCREWSMRQPMKKDAGPGVPVRE